MKLLISAMFLSTIASAAISADDTAKHQAHHKKEISWTQASLLKLKRGRSRSEKKLRLTNLNADSVTVYPARDLDELSNWSEATEKGQVSVKSQAPKQGGYHWVSASEKTDDVLRSANTIIYFSNPGDAPRHMLNAEKTVLEIFPLKLPREHRHYRSKEQWPFVVRFKGQPAANAPVVMQTANGSRSTYTTDALGKINLLFPDDFKPVEDSHGEGHSRRRKTDFVLTVRRNEDKQRYVTNFNYHYTPEAFDQKSLSLGIGFAAFGMLLASPLLRKREKKQVKKGKA